MEAGGGAEPLTLTTECTGSSDLSGATVFCLLSFASIVTSVSMPSVCSHCWLVDRKAV